MSVKQKVIKILSTKYIFMSSLTLLYLTIIRSHWLFRMYQYIKFDVCQVKGSQDIERSVYSYAQFDPWPFTFYLKIKSCHLLFRIYQSTKFEVCHAKGS
jgi:hypothetical protein